LDAVFDFSDDLLCKGHLHKPNVSVNSPFQIISQATD